MLPPPTGTVTVVLRRVERPLVNVQLYLFPSVKDSTRPAQL